MKTKALILIVLLCAFSIAAFGQTIYQWTDEKGNINFTDDMSNVPEKYRDQVQERKPPKEPAPPAPVETIQGTDADRKQATSPAPPVTKDIIGRGEDWWRRRAMEWNEKLIDAQKNYDATFAAWKAKEQELVDSVHRADYIKRRLKLEIKDLEEKTKEWERKRDEAKNMLEKVIPKEAEDYKADPEWIRVK